MKTKSAFVTGANGFIGSYLTKYLAEQGIETTAFILKGTDCFLLKNIYPSLKNVRIVEGNILDKDSLRKHVKGMNYIFHLAGVIKGYSQEDFDRVNIIGTKFLFDACSNNSHELERLVIVSSSSAAGYGTPEDPLVEDKVAEPILNDCYGISKYRMECLAKSYNEKLPISIVRPCSVLGPGNYVTLDNYKTVKLGIKLMMAGPKRYMSVVDVEDLTRGIFLCAENPKAIGEVFYFSNERIVSLIDLSEIVNYKIFNRKYGSLLTINVPRFALHLVASLLEFIHKLQRKPAPFFNRSKVPGVFAPGQVVSSEKARKILGWKPKYTIVETVTREGKWNQDQGWI
ncbi:MAG: NAD(P)-dependent oxidoreductase [Candidatus Heimdallarchaeota archaeon]|nr:NAD(P)-dependent oxidoreductase [Candidatus Heimdallarchaeota archaeon]MBY8993104.1 NAD(P)-dependent oxidoreductase [Candidatus Heimdallarchaeota archaeon]